MRLWQAIRNAWSEPLFWEQPASPLLASVVRDRETIANDFEGYVQHAYKSNGVVFACILVRLLVFSEARFMFRRMENGRPQQLFGDETLRLLERPWPNGTTGELLAHMEQDVSLGGNFYATVVGEGDSRRVRRLRPDWVTIITGSRTDNPFALDAQPIAYIYQPKNFGVRPEPDILTPDQVVHYSPIPDPVAQWRGMSWLTPIVKEVQADSAATEHKLNFFKRGATRRMAVKYDPSLSKDEVAEYVELFKEQHEGADNAYRTLHLGGGAEPFTVGADLEQLDFKATQGAGETRIIMAAGLHPVVVGASEGMQGSSLNAGNFNSARRRVADGTFRPLWRIAAAALESLVPPPDRGAHLWYDDRDVAFLQEDQKDRAEIQSQDATTINVLIDAGFDPDSVVAAVDAEDFRLLKHTGLVSVQLQPPGADNSVAVPVNLAPQLLADGWSPAQHNGHKQGVLT